MKVAIEVAIGAAEQAHVTKLKEAKAKADADYQASEAFIVLIRGGRKNR